MTFENENTWIKAVKSSGIKQFHAAYDKSVHKVKSEFSQHYMNYIDGKPKVSRGGEFVDTSPADTRIVLGYFQKSTREDAREAIASAKASFPQWSKMDYKERIRIFLKAADLMAKRKFQLAALLSFENGKNRFEAIADIDEAIDFLRYYSYQMEKNKGFTTKMHKASSNEDAVSVLKPYGVWGVIAPFNFPAAIAVGMSAGALITGNTVIFKPASDTPLMGLRIYEILTQAGLPDGVMNFITGPGATVGVEIAANPDVAGIVFTGSLDVGRSICAAAASSGRPRPIITEMGGKNPTIVTANADVDMAVEGVVRSAFGYGGQKCSACSRVYVDKHVKNDFTAKLVKRTRKLTIGKPTDEKTFLGPVINERAYSNYQQYVEIIRGEGKILTGGRIRTDEDLKYGYYVEPTIIDNLPKNHRFFKEELFLPILTVASVESLDEALALANDVDYGLTGGIFTRDEKEITRFFNEIQAGVTYANRSLGATTGAMVGAQAFVGWKLSGSSGKGAGGPYYIQQFLREQAQTIIKTKPEKKSSPRKH